MVKVYTYRRRPLLGGTAIVLAETPCHCRTHVVVCEVIQFGLVLSEENPKHV